ncbi:LysM peptidoglycan-binding domain-containing protein [Filobacillus milosensis]|uniref:LysM peptidoglycan-binding domain-containing protein n=1 Tax=Filobacillus milosensis TaxID=94137 RepID=A0A4Y8IT20_9BACI|nr:LysM domain-containing protein [Filobacillus milosensis]TFB24942.1 LysM peptidoglycan-binding domain-containing protein [Filobacillus milosensis]
MSTHGNEPFLFDMHEQISFRQGEEIDDLYGISIQPDVNIIKESNYIQLRGVLMVSGDYQSLPGEEPMYYMDDSDEENYVQQVKALDNGFTTFQYPIPVDITLPSNRVNETGEPDVEIEYFDYELPEPKTLHVYAKIRLANVEMIEEDAVRHEEEVSPDFQLQEVPSFEDDEFDETENSEPQSEDNDEKGREFWQKKQSQSFNEFFNKKEEAKVNEESKQQENKEAVEQKKPKEEKKKAAEQEKQEEKKKAAEQKPQKDENEQVKEAENKKSKKQMEVNEKAQKKKKKEKPKAKSKEEENIEPAQNPSNDQMEGEESDNEKPKKKGMLGLNYLSNFFRDADEPEKVQVRMRFVQENETIDSIANAYQVSVAHLERLNGLDSENHLKAGDVLYVPYKK